MTTTDTEPVLGDLSVTLTIAEAQALQKTIGIALQNLQRKAATSSGRVREEALEDYRHLQEANSEIALALVEAI